MCLARVDPLQAAIAIEALRKKDPDNLENCVQYAHVYLLAGDANGYKRLCTTELGRGDRLKCLDLPGRRSYLLARLCLLAPDATVDPSLPTQLAEQALREMPSCAYYLHTLGVAHYRAGRYAEAIKRLTESIEADAKWTGQPLNRVVLAMAHQRLGRTDVAEMWFQQAAQLVEKDGNLRPWRATAAGMHVHDWLEWLRLRKEAESLIAAK